MKKIVFMCLGNEIGYVTSLQCMPIPQIGQRLACTDQNGNVICCDIVDVVLQYTSLTATVLITDRRAKRIA